MDPTSRPRRGWERIQELFHAALARPATDRESFLEAVCDDSQLRAEVLLLLAAHEEGGFVPSEPGSSSIPNLPVGDLLNGKYAITRELGQGGMAVVYLADDVRHHREVAIKVLRPELAAAIGAERFLEEIRVTAQLNHPHIIPLLDSGNADGLLYYVTPYIEGESLRQRLALTGRIAPHEALQLVIEIADGLDAAHEQGVIHRDIKPDNILLRRGHALVADFGIARALREAGGESLTAAGAVIGTPAYMPPEQALGRMVTPATDVYALGLVLFEMLTGRRASAGAAGDRMDWSGVPTHVRPALERALDPRPEARWADGGAFRDALKKPPKSARALRRTVVIAVAAMAVVTLVVLGGRALMSNTPAASSRVAVLPFAVRGSEALAYLQDGMVDLLSAKLDGGGEFQSADPRAVLSLAGGMEDQNERDRAQRIARELDAGFYVLGSLVEVQGRLRVDAALYDAVGGGDAIAHGSAEGSASDVFAVVDEVAAALLVGRSVGPAGRTARIAAVTTGDLDALKAYLEGEQAFRAAQFTAAVDALERAVAVDSTFALAWFRLSAAAQFLGMPALARESAERAVRFGERLSDRDRLRLDGMLAERQGDDDRAEATYRAVIETHPDDVEAWQQLGEVQFHFGPWAGQSPVVSRAAWERVRRYDPREATAYLHLARIAALEGDRAALDSLERAFRELDPERARVSDMRVLRVFAGGDRTARDEAIQRLREGSDREILIAAHYTGAFARDLDGAADIAALMADPERPPATRALGHALRAHLALAACHWDAAEEEVSRAVADDAVRGLLHRGFLALVPFAPVTDAELAVVRADLEAWDASAVPPSPNRAAWFAPHDGVHPHLRAYLLGALAARQGDGAAVDRYVQELMGLSTPDEAGSLAEDLAASLRAHRALAEGDSAAARAALESAPRRIWWQLGSFSPFFSRPHERYILGILQEEAGDLPAAIRSFQSFEGFSAYDLIYAAPANRRLAQIYRRLGDVQQADDRSRRFADAWVNCDPALRSVLD